MIAQEREKLRQQLIRHEEMRLYPYRCSKGKTTIGVGRNLDDRGITEEEAYYLLDNDITISIREMSQFVWFKDLSDMRQRVWIDLHFNLGMPTLSMFKRALEAMSFHNYELAAQELMDSKWARMVGKRADWLCKALVSGVEPPRT